MADTTRQVLVQFTGNPANLLSAFKTIEKGATSLASTINTINTSVNSAAQQSMQSQANLVKQAIAANQGVINNLKNQIAGLDAALIQQRKVAADTATALAASSANVTQKQAAQVNSTRAVKQAELEVAAAQKAVQAQQSRVNDAIVNYNRVATTAKTGSVALAKAAAQVTADQALLANRTNEASTAESKLTSLQRTATSQLGALTTATKQHQAASVAAAKADQEVVTSENKRKTLEVQLATSTSNLTKQQTSLAAIEQKIAGVSNQNYTAKLKLTDGTQKYAAAAKTATTATNSLGAGFISAGTHIGGLYVRVQGLQLALAGLGRILTQIGHQGFNFLKEAIQPALDFQQTMVTTTTIMNKGQQAADDLRAKVLQLGKETIFSSQQVADAAQVLVKAGVDSADIISGALKAVTNVAAGAQADMTEVAKTITTGMAVFHKGGADTVELGNQMAKTINASKLELTDYADALKNAGSALSLFNVKQTDFDALLAFMAQRGFKGDEAGTAIRYFLTRLVPSTQVAIDIMKQFNLLTINTSQIMKDFGASFGSVNVPAEELMQKLYSLHGGEGALVDQTDAVVQSFQTWALRAGYINSQFFDMKGNLKDVNTVGQILSDTFGNLPKPTALMDLGKILGERGGGGSKVAGSLIDAFSSGVNPISEWTKKIQDSADASTVAAAVTQTLKGRIEYLSSSIETLGINFASNFEQPGKRIVNMISGFVDGINDLLTKNPKLAQMAATFLTVASAIAAVAGPMLLIAAIVPTLGGALVEAAALFIPLAGVLSVVAAGVVGLKDQLLDPSSGVVGALMVTAQRFAEMGNQAKGVLDTLLHNFLEPLGQVLVAVFVGKVLPTLATFAQWFLTILPPLVSGFGSLMLQVIGAAADAWNTILVPALRFAGGLFTQVLLPALALVGGYLTQNIVPVFRILATVLVLVAARTLLLKGYNLALLIVQQALGIYANIFNKQLVFQGEAIARNSVLTRILTVIQGTFNLALRVGNGIMLVTRTLFTLLTQGVFLHTVGVRAATIATGIFSGALRLLGITIDFVKLTLGPVALAIAAIGIVVALVKSAWDNDFLGIREIVGSAVQFIMDKFGWLLQGIKFIGDALGTVFNFIGSLFGIPQDKADESSQAMQDSFSQVPDSLSQSGDDIQTQMQKMAGAFDIADSTKQAGADATSAFGDGLTGSLHDGTIVGQVKTLTIDIATNGMGSAESKDAAAKAGTDLAKSCITGGSPDGVIPTLVASKGDVQAAIKQNVTDCFGDTAAQEDAAKSSTLVTDAYQKVLDANIELYKPKASQNGQVIAAALGAQDVLAKAGQSGKAVTTAYLAECLIGLDAKKGDVEAKGIQTAGTLGNETVSATAAQSGNTVGTSFVYGNGSGGVVPAVVYGVGPTFSTVLAFINSCLNVTPQARAWGSAVGGNFVAGLQSALANLPADVRPKIFTGLNTSGLTPQTRSKLLGLAQTVGILVPGVNYGGNPNSPPAPPNVPYIGPNNFPLDPNEQNYLNRRSFNSKGLGTPNTIPAPTGSSSGGGGGSGIGGGGGSGSGTPFSGIDNTGGNGGGGGGGSTKSAAQTAADAVKAVAEAIKAGVAAFKAISQLQIPSNLAQKAQEFAAGAAVLITAIQSVALQYSDKNLATISAFADAGGKVTDFLSKFVDFVKKINDPDFTLGPVVAKVTVLIAQAHIMMNLLGSAIAKTADGPGWDEDGIQLVGDFADAGGKVVDFLSKFVDFVKKINDPDFKLGPVVAKVTVLIKQAHIMMNLLGSAISGTADGPGWTDDNVATVGAFADAGGKVTDFLTKFADFVQKLNSPTFNLSSVVLAVQQLVTEAVLMMDALGSALTGKNGWTPENVAKVGTFADNGGKVADFVSKFADLMLKLTAPNVNLADVSAAVQSLVNEAALMMDNLGSALTGKDGWTNENVARVGTFSDNGGKVADFISKFVDAVQKINTPGANLKDVSAVIQSLVNEAVLMMDDLGAVLSGKSGWTDANVARVGAFADSVGKVADAVSKAFTFVVALANATDIDYSKLDVTKLVGFIVTLVTQFSTALSDAIKESEATQGKSTTLLSTVADTVGKVTDGVDKVLKLVTDLASAAEQAAAPRSDLLAPLLAFTTSLVQAFSQAKDQLLAAVGTDGVIPALADAVGKVVDGVGKSLSVMTGLADYTSVGQGAIDAFVGDLLKLMAHIPELASSVSDAALKAAAAWAAGVGPAMDVLKNAIDVFKGLTGTEQETTNSKGKTTTKLQGGFTPVDPKLIDEFIASLVLLVQKLGKGLDQVAPEILDVANKFALKIGPAMDVLTKALDLFLKILPDSEGKGGLKHIDPNAIGELVGDLYLLLHHWYNLVIGFPADLPARTAVFANLLDTVLTIMERAVGDVKKIQDAGGVDSLVDAFTKIAAAMQKAASINVPPIAQSFTQMFTDIDTEMKRQAEGKEQDTILYNWSAKDPEKSLLYHMWFAFEGKGGYRIVIRLAFKGLMQDIENVFTTFIPGLESAWDAFMLHLSTSAAQAAQSIATSLGDIFSKLPNGNNTSTNVPAIKLPFQTKSLGNLSGLSSSGLNSTFTTQSAGNNPFSAGSGNGTVKNVNNNYSIRHADFATPAKDARQARRELVRRASDPG